MTSPAPIKIPGSLLRRIYGLGLRHIYLYMGSWPRLVEMLYWPMLQLILFGFVSLSVVDEFSNATIMADTFLGGLMLAEVMTSVIRAMLVMHMEEIWSHNLGHLFASPLRLRDYVGGLIGLGTLRGVLSVVPAFVAVYFLFGFSILHLGWLLPVYMALLCFNAWWYGIVVVSFLLRYGLAAEWLGWMLVWALMPLMAPYYPVSILPHALQIAAWTLPGTYIFESMKAQIATGSARMDEIGIALALNLLYFLVAAAIFARAYRHARTNGGLLQTGE